MLNRRRMMQGTAALAFAGYHGAAFAQDQPAVPIVFVHGDSDAAAIWQTTIWRFESNGYPRDRLFAISFTDPQARDDDTVAQPNRSSTQDQLRELTAFIDNVKSEDRRGEGRDRRAVARRLCDARLCRRQSGRASALPCSCGTPNHGVFAIDALLGSEYNGHGAFLTKLNAGDSEVTPGVPFLTLRSDGFDLYAQPDGAFHRPSRRADRRHRRRAGAEGRDQYSARAGRSSRDGAAARAPSPKSTNSSSGARRRGSRSRPRAEVVLNGLVTGVVERHADQPSGRGRDRWKSIACRPRPASGRAAAPFIRRRPAPTACGGRRSSTRDAPLEFVVAAPGAPVTHIYRSAFPRSFAPARSRPSAAIAKEDAEAAAIVKMDRPRGYFGLPRDIVLLDGKEPGRHPARRARGLAYEAEAGGRRRPPDRRRIQRGADRRPGLAGEGQSCDDGGADGLREHPRSKRATVIARERGDEAIRAERCQTPYGLLRVLPRESTAMTAATA